MKTKIQVRVVAQIDGPLDVMHDLACITETDVELVFIVPYRGCEIICSDVHEAREAISLILNDVIKERSVPVSAERNTAV